MRARTEDLLPYALLLPSIFFLALLILLPMIQALLLAVQADTGELTTEHLQRMTSDVNFSDAWRNTLLLIVLIVPLQIVLALAMALLSGSSTSMPSRSRSPISRRGSCGSPCSQSVDT